MFIKEVSARAIVDSRGEETIEVSVNGCKASSPSGKSTGKHETPTYRKSLAWNISAIKSLKELKLIDINSFDDLSKVEAIIRRKFNLNDAKKFGANALFALESATLKALAKAEKKELWEIVNPHARRIPVPLGNVIGGGMHSSCSPNLTFQEFLLAPQGRSAKENFAIMKRVHAQVKSMVKAKRMNDEGAWESDLNEEQALELLSRFKRVRIGIDVAASSFYRDGEYNYSFVSLDRSSQINFVNSLVKKFRLLYVEDPLHEEDFAAFFKIDKKALVSGDDLTATHLPRLHNAVRMKSINAMIVKPNQNGSLLELKKICDYCRARKIKIILSHRSGETLDSALADYAVAFGANYLKCGIATKWREAKLKRLIEIEGKIKHPQ